MESACSIIPDAEVATKVVNFHLLSLHPRQFASILSFLNYPKLINNLCLQCKQMVDNYLPELLAMLEKNIDPQMICSLLGMCNGVKDLVQHHPINSLHRVALIKVCAVYFTHFLENAALKHSNNEWDFILHEILFVLINNFTLCHGWACYRNNVFWAPETAYTSEWWKFLRLGVENIRSLSC